MSAAITKDRNRISGWLLLGIAVVLCNLFVMRFAIVYGVSMEPTLQQHDILLVWQLGYTPQTGDIVVTDRDNAVGQHLIKRVTATEGETVTFERNGEQVQFVVPAGQVFLTGDNHDHSTDSRELGCFSVDSIKGKVVVRWFPFTKITVF